MRLGSINYQLLALVVLLSVAIALCNGCRQLPDPQPATSDDAAVYCVEIAEDHARAATTYMDDSSALVRQEGRYFYCLQFSGEK